MFEVTGKCFIRSIKTDRAESADALTKSKVWFNVPELSHESAAGVLLCALDMPLIFFDGDQDGLPVLMKGITNIACGNAWEKMHSVKFGQMKKYAVAQLRVLNMTPVTGGIFDANLLVLFEFENPNDNFIEQMGQACNREINLVIAQTEPDPPEQKDLEDEIKDVKKANKAKETQTDAFEKPTKPTKAKPRTKEEAQAARSKKKKNAAPKAPTSVVEAPAAASDPVN